MAEYPGVIEDEFQDLVSLGAGVVEGVGVVEAVPQVLVHFVRSLLVGRVLRLHLVHWVEVLLHVHVLVAHCASY